MINYIKVKTKLKHDVRREKSFSEDRNDKLYRSEN